MTRSTTDSRLERYRVTLSGLCYRVTPGNAGNRLGNVTTGAPGRVLPVTHTLRVGNTRRPGPESARLR